MSLDRASLEAFRVAAERRIGLSLDDAKLEALSGTLRQRAVAAGRDPSVYVFELENRGTEAEWRALASDLVVSETYFFRAADQLRAFREFAESRLRSTRSLRVLSAGCASGEEPFSLAILLREAVPEIDTMDVRLRAVDVNGKGLFRAERGRYARWALRETPSEIQARWFREEGREFVLDEKIRRMVQIGESNLAEDDSALWPAGGWDVVFCRNVLMYFTPDAARRLVARIAHSLASGGLLFLGHAETLRSLSNDFQLLHTHGTFYYGRKPGHLVAAPVLPELDVSMPVVSPAPDSWVDAIRHASERVEALTTLPREREEVRSTPAGWDMAGAIELLRQERFADAEALLRAAPLASSSDPDLLLLKAVLSTHGGNLQEAERLSRELLARDDMNAGAHYLLALCREAASDRAGAVDHDQTAAYLDPAFAMPRLHLGLLARRAGDDDGARRELRQALLLLEREEPSRLLLFGGGFRREALLALCRAELAACGGVAG